MRAQSIEHLVCLLPPPTLAPPNSLRSEKNSSAPSRDRDGTTSYIVKRWVATSSIYRFPHTGGILNQRKEKTAKFHITYTPSNQKRTYRRFVSGPLPGCFRRRRPWQDGRARDPDSGRRRLRRERMGRWRHGAGKRSGQRSAARGWSGKGSRAAGRCLVSSRSYFSF